MQINLDKNLGLLGLLSLWNFLSYPHKQAFLWNFEFPFLFILKTAKIKLRNVLTIWHWYDMHMDINREENLIGNPHG